MRRALTIAVLLVGVLAACGGGSSGSSSDRGSSDQDLQAARMAAIAGCQAVAIASTAPGAATAQQLQAIPDAFNGTSGVAYPGTGPLLRRLLTASSPAARLQAVSDLQRWCASRGFAPQR